MRSCICNNLSILLSILNKLLLLLLLTLFLILINNVDPYTLLEMFEYLNTIPILICSRKFMQLQAIITPPFSNMD